MTVINTLKLTSVELLKGALLALALTALTAAVVPQNLTRINPVAAEIALGSGQA